MRRRCCRTYSQNSIGYSELLNMVKKYSAMVIDVRSEQEYAEGHFNGAINIPLYNIKEKISDYVSDKNQVIVVYCSAGIRSVKAKSILNSLGYSNVYNLVQGYR